MPKKKMDLASITKLREMSAAGKDRTKIAKELGVSRGCVQYQQNKPENAAAIAERREELAQMCEDVAVRSLGFISDDKLSKSSAAQLSIIGATQLDKAAMLRGQGNSGVHVTINIGDPTTRQVTLQSNDDTIDVTPE